MEGAFFLSSCEYVVAQKTIPNWFVIFREKSGLKPEPDEDNYEKADVDTVKAREWDEFKEANPRYIFIHLHRLGTLTYYSEALEIL